MSPCIPLRLSNRSYFTAHLSIKAESMEAAVHLCYEQISRAVVTQHWLGCNWCLAKACQSTSQRRTPSSDRSDRHIKSLYTLTGFLPWFDHRLMTATHYLHGLHTGRSKSEHAPHTIQPQQTCQQQVNDRLNSRASFLQNQWKAPWTANLTLLHKLVWACFHSCFRKKIRNNKSNLQEKCIFICMSSVSLSLCAIVWSNTRGHLMNLILSWQLAYLQTFFFPTTKNYYYLKLYFENEFGFF